MTTPCVAFLVTRAGLTVGRWPGRPAVWEEYHHQGLEDTDGGPLRVPEVVLFDRAAAERERERRELAVREMLNPFWFGPIRELSSRDATTVHARLRELGSFPVPLSYADVDDWVAWWDRESANWTAEQRTAIWDMLDKIRLFEVIEIEVE